MRIVKEAIEPNEAGVGRGRALLKRLVAGTVLGLLVGSGVLRAQPDALPTPTTMAEAIQQREQLDRQLYDLKEDIKNIPELIRQLDVKERELTRLTARRDKLRKRKHK